MADNQPVQPGNAPAAAGSQPAGAAAKATAPAIDASVMQTFLFPLTQEVIGTIYGKQSDQEPRRQVLQKFLDKNQTPLEPDKRTFDEAFFKQKRDSGVHTAFTRDTEFQDLFRDALFNALQKQGEISGKMETAYLYAPDEKGAFNSEATRRIQYLTYEIANEIENKKIRQLVKSGQTTGTQAQLDNGNLRLFVTPDGSLVALTEEEAKKPENAKLKPYIGYGLREESLGRHITPDDEIGAHFDDSRAETAERMLEENGLKIVEHFTVDRDGNARGKVMALGVDPNKDGPVLSVLVRPNRSPLITAANPNQLRFDFKFDNFDNLQKAEAGQPGVTQPYPSEFHLYSGDLSKFKNPDGTARRADEVARDAQRLESIRTAPGEPEAPFEPGARLQLPLPRGRIGLEEAPPAGGDEAAFRARLPDRRLPSLVPIPKPKAVEEPEKGGEITVTTRVKGDGGEAVVEEGEEPTVARSRAARQGRPRAPGSTMQRPPEAGETYTEAPPAPARKRGIPPAVGAGAAVGATVAATLGGVVAGAHKGASAFFDPQVLPNFIHTVTHVARVVGGLFFQ